MVLAVENPVGVIVPEVEVTAEDKHLLCYYLVYIIFVKMSPPITVL